MKRNKILTTWVDSTEIEGVVILLTKTELKIEIVSPFSGITGAAPVFPGYLRHISGYTDNNGVMSEVGVKTATRVLQEIYNGCLFFTQHREELKMVYASLQNQASAHNTDKENTDYLFFTEIIRTYHKKMSFQLVRQLIKKFL
jgi:hypothetical protein